MGYALFAQRKVTLTSQLNTVSLKQTQRSNEQYALATQTLSLQQQLSSLQSAQALELADYYTMLSFANKDGMDPEFRQKYGSSLEDDFSEEAIDFYIDSRRNPTRDQINAKIKEIENENQRELDDINRKIYLVSVKENAIEMEVKRLDTQVSAIQKQLEAVEEAESSAIDRATPKFNGVG